MEVFHCRHCGRPIDYRDDEDFLGWYHSRVNMRHCDYRTTVASPLYRLSTKRKLP